MEEEEEREKEEGCNKNNRRVEGDGERYKRCFTMIFSNVPKVRFKVFRLIKNLL